MGLFLGSEIKGVYCGVTEVKEAYAGAVKVFGKSAGNVVHIGEHDYGVVKIGSLYWISENLYEELGVLNTDYRWYTNDKNYSIQKKFGAHYRFSTICISDGKESDLIKSILPNGWRVPSVEDFGSLVENVGNDMSKLKSSDGWKLYNGTDDFNFCIKPAGFISNKGVSSYETESSFIWTKKAYSSSASKDFYVYYNTNKSSYRNDNILYYLSVRLCKDA